ncbi:unnamed protein product [Caenorhabditis auriculariae]|uniref:Uncharacterized protein n=1 Tax=Caenorhabditis auriculariae TaxID=2777116 RepID=A0A8S1GXC6_9PELO|nr:unnamed protein product [Caenorhabditis auriculariae]
MGEFLTSRKGEENWAWLVADEANTQRRRRDVFGWRDLRMQISALTFSINLSSSADTLQITSEPALRNVLRWNATRNEQTVGKSLTADAA